MIWLWIVLGIVVLLSSVQILGMLLPVRYSSRAQLTLSQPPEEVWKALCDHQAHPVSAAMVKGVEELAPEEVGPSWREDLGNSSLVVKTLESVPPSRLVRSMEDTVVPLFLRWEYAIHSAPGGSTVELREEGRIERGTFHVPFFRMMVRLMPGAGPRAHLNSIAKTLGETNQAS